MDLQNNYKISSINMFNSVDCCSYSLANFHVKMLQAGATVWTYEYSGTPGYETIVNVPSKVGDKVAISLVCERKILTLAEVEVNVDFCPTINIPATHATVGDIKYDNQLSINGWFPAGTKATLPPPPPPHESSSRPPQHQPPPPFPSAGAGPVGRPRPRHQGGGAPDPPAGRSAHSFRWRHPSGAGNGDHGGPRRPQSAPT